VRLDLQAEAVHPQRAAHALVAVQAVGTRDHVQHFPVMGDGDGPRVGDGPRHIVRPDRARAADPHHAPAVDRRHLATGQADERPPDLIAAAALGLVHRGRNRGGEGVHVRHHALLHATARLHAQADHVDVFFAHFPDNGADFRRAHVDANH